MPSLFLAVLFLIASLLTGSATAEDQRFRFERAEMGLPFRVTLYAPDEASARAAADAAFERIALLNGIMSDYDSDSELSRLSRTSGSGQAVPVSTLLWTVLERSQQLAERTGGAFDITVGPLVNVWRYARRKHELPRPDLLAQMHQRTGFRSLHLDPSTKSATLLLPDMRLDLGGIAKGFAVDQALAVLREKGFPRAFVAGSGDMAFGEPPPGERGWRIEVGRIEEKYAPPAEVLELANCAIATSGDVFQYVEIDGVRYSHIVNPWTGVGLTDHSLVTIIARDGITADSLATAVSVLGPERGLPFIEELPGAAALIARKPADRVEIVTSSRWAELPRPTADR
ncbi:MAG: FAD:protein FMN transferase [Chthoniobacteraceae bacterium]